MRFLPILVMLLPLCAQPPQEAPKKGRGPFQPKNLKILKPEQVRSAMGAFRAALGVQCTFCHVEGDFASDEKPQKNTARMMITMVHEINGKFPAVEGKMYVTCYTCHRGKTEPDTAPPPATPQGPGGPGQ